MCSDYSLFFFRSYFGLRPCRLRRFGGTDGASGAARATGRNRTTRRNRPPKEGIIIEQRLSSSLYDADGNIFIVDDRITPTTFQALYLKAAFLNLGPDAAAYMPLDYLIVYAVSLVPEENELETPLLVVTEGMLLIVDPNRDLLAVALGSFFDGIDVNLAILVSQ